MGIISGQPISRHSSSSQFETRLPLNCRFTALPRRSSDCLQSQSAESPPINEKLGVEEEDEDGGEELGAMRAWKGAGMEIVYSFPSKNTTIVRSLWEIRLRKSSSIANANLQMINIPRCFFWIDLSNVEIFNPGQSFSSMFFFLFSLARAIDHQ